MRSQRGFVLHMPIDKFELALYSSISLMQETLQLYNVTARVALPLPAARYPEPCPRTVRLAGTRCKIGLLVVRTCDDELR